MYDKTKKRICNALSGIFLIICLGSAGWGVWIMIFGVEIGITSVTEADLSTVTTKIATTEIATGERVFIFCFHYSFVCMR